jgi:phytanoyl-CoA hydroxylase
MSNAPTRSPFGGLWTDRLDAMDELNQRVRLGRVSSDLQPILQQWITDGYAVLESAADQAVCDRLAEQLATAWKNGHPDQIIVDSRTGVPRPLVAGDEPRLTRAVDSHVHFEAAQQLLASRRVVQFLAAVFDADPLYFQTLVFEVGSEQGLHQDTAFVVVDRPLELVGVWFALEDVAPGSGELRYVPGSHQLPDHSFGPGRRHYDPTVDPREAHDRYYLDNVQRCDAAGLTEQRFLPKQGDVLLWSADLVHGGSPIVDASLTRRSLVAHACPTTANPHFFSYLPDHRTTIPLGDSGARFASHYHRLG